MLTSTTKMKTVKRTTQSIQRSETSKLCCECRFFYNTAVLITTNECTISHNYSIRYPYALLANTVNVHI